MRTIAHLSDLHFGALNREVTDALVQDLRQKPPDILIVSGDLTQRAKVRQFQEAREFLNAVPKLPQIIVPGNHDVPLFRVWSRFFKPLSDYRHHIQTELDTVFEDSELLILGLNSARSFTFSGGDLSSAQRDWVNSKIKNTSQSKIRILVSHHPLWTLRPKSTTPFLQLQLDLLLSGHVHQSRARMTEHGLMIEAGTSTSNRTRTEPNSFNRISIDGSQINVQHWIWSDLEKRFLTSPTHTFQLKQRIELC